MKEQLVTLGSQRSRGREACENETFESQYEFTTRNAEGSDNKESTVEGVAWFRNWLEEDLRNLPSHIDETGNPVMLKFKPLKRRTEFTEATFEGQVSYIIDDSEFWFPSPGRQDQYAGPTRAGRPLGCIVVEVQDHCVAMLVELNEIEQYKVGDTVTLDNRSQPWNAI